MRPVQVVEGRDVVEYPVVQATLTRRYTDRVVSFIHRNKDRPFFLYFAQAMPHKPLATTEQYYRKSGSGLYGDVIAELDASVGRVLDAIKTNGLDDRTLVIFTSDNGAWFGGSCGGLRGMKGTNWEGGYRVPMIARWPGKIPAGHVSREPAVTMDIFATVLAVTNSSLPDDRVIDGRNLLPLLTSDAKSPHDVIFGHQGPKLATVRDSRWKLHVLPSRGMVLKAEATGRWLDPRAPDGVTILAPFEQYNLDAYPGLTTGVPAAAMQLFDLDHDPGEQTDVAKDHPEHVAILKARFDEMNAVVPNVPPVTRVPLAGR